MNRLYIFIILVGISFVGCSKSNRSIDRDNSYTPNEQQDTSSVNNKVQQDSLRTEQNAKDKEETNKEQNTPIAKEKCWLLFSVFVNACLLIIVYKKNIRISELEDKEAERDKSRKNWNYEPKYPRKNPYSASSSSSTPQTPSPISSNTPIEEQQEIVKEEEAIVIDFPLKSEKSYKYLMPAYQGKFTKLFDEPSGKTRFRCWTENGICFFEFHGDLKTAIENYNATFDDTCIVEGSYVGATRYKTEEFGTMDKDLKILTKSIIRLY